MPTDPRVVRFGVFEVDLRAGELRKQAFDPLRQDSRFEALLQETRRAARADSTMAIQP
jgi:hypothetical protein